MLYPNSKYCLFITVSMSKLRNSSHCTATLFSGTISPLQSAPPRQCNDGAPLRSN